MSEEEIETTGPYMGFPDPKVWNALHSDRLDALPTEVWVAMESEVRIADTNALYANLVERGFIE